MSQPGTGCLDQKRKPLRALTPGKRMITLWLAAAVCVATAASAQCRRSVDSPPRNAKIPQVGGAEDDSSRLGSLVGACWGNASLLRSAHVLGAATDTTSGLRLTLVDPTVNTIWNSRIPFSANDGAMWAGRGVNLSAMAGIKATFRRLQIAILPQLTQSQNLIFPTLRFSEGVNYWVDQAPDPNLSPYASPWHSGRFSADLPLRFGNVPYQRIDAGDTFVQLVVARIDVGLTSADQWWGPGIRNALLISNNAAGIPRGYLSTHEPIHTRLGELEAQWMLGGLTESPFFNDDVRDDLRSISAAVFTLRLAADSGLTLGVERAVYAAVRRAGGVPFHVADVFLDWHQPVGVGVLPHRSEQIMGLFGRWVFPAAGFSVHTEWAKIHPPTSLRELLVDAQNGQGYTIGLEWARALAPATLLQFQAEVTTLEQTPKSVTQEVPEFYVSQGVRQGFTQEGQVIGASIGPGSSSQYITTKLLHKNWQLGGLLERTRWEEDAYYRTQALPTYKSHDISLSAGLTGAFDSPWFQLEGSFRRMLRMNYLFQTNSPYVYGSAFDVRNSTLSLKLTPHILR